MQEARNYGGCIITSLHLKSLTHSHFSDIEMSVQHGGNMASILNSRPYGTASNCSMTDGISTLTDDTKLSKCSGIKISTPVPVGCGHHSKTKEVPTCGY